MAEDNPGADKSLTDSDQNASLKSTPTSSSYLKRIFLPHPNLTAKVPRGLLKTMQKNSWQADKDHGKIDPSKRHEHPPPTPRKSPIRLGSIIRNAILGRKDSSNMGYRDEGRSESHDNGGGLDELTWKKESDCAQVAVGSGGAKLEYLNWDNQTLADQIASSFSVSLSLREYDGEQNGEKCDKANRHHENGPRVLPSLQCKASSDAVVKTTSTIAKMISMSGRTRRTSFVQTQGSTNADADEVNQQGQKQCEQKNGGGSNSEDNSQKPRSNKKRNKIKEDTGKNGSSGAREELCKKRILIGKRCKPLTLSCALHYDEEGVLIPEGIP